MANHYFSICFSFFFFSERCGFRYFANDFANDFVTMEGESCADASSAAGDGPGHHDHHDKEDLGTAHEREAPSPSV